MKVVILIAASALTFLAPNLLVAGEPLNIPASYWAEESFLKSFSASYGVNSRVEPTVSPEEKKVLVQVAEWMKKGEKKRALQALLASKSSASSPALLYNQANVYLELGEEVKAIDAYKAAIKKYPSFRRAHKNLGLTYLRAAQFPLAKSSLVKAVSLGDMSGSTLGMLGYCHLQSEQYASALQAYRLAQLTEPDTIEWKAGVAQCLLETGQHKEALYLMKEVVQARPSEVSYQLLMVNILLQHGEDVKAIAALEWLGRQGELPIEHTALLAQLHAQNGTVDLARPWFDQVKKGLKLEVYPQYLRAIEAVLQLSDWELAEELLSVDLVGAELDDSLLNKRDRLRAIVLIELDKLGAKPLLQQIVERNPLDGAALVLLGKVSATEEKFEVAEFYFRRAEKIESSKYAALFGYGVMLVSQKNYGAAIGKFELAQKLHPTAQQQKYIEALRRLVRK
jgi:tetratricopeptide (TPR) repeat protein